ncbi:hypothetical protein AB9K35_15790 [Leisingera sp. XS_AS12]|uniref:hypothetical protein n=1 Tax=unclassified Leisingera TaxID=2614906 RepID=UPI003514499E
MTDLNQPNLAVKLQRAGLNGACAKFSNHLRKRTFILPRTLFLMLHTAPPAEVRTDQAFTYANQTHSSLLEA